MINHYPQEISYRILHQILIPLYCFMHLCFSLLLIFGLVGLLQYSIFSFCNFYLLFHLYNFDFIPWKFVYRKTYFLMNVENQILRLYFFSMLLRRCIKKCAHCLWKNKSNDIKIAVIGQVRENLKNSLAIQMDVVMTLLKKMETSIQ